MTRLLKTGLAAGLAAGLLGAASLASAYPRHYGYRSHYEHCYRPAGYVYYEPYHVRRAYYRPVYYYPRPYYGYGSGLSLHISLNLGGRHRW